MSTTSCGEAKRSFISGTRLWPPARTLASSPPSCSMPIASASERGASYRNRDGYIDPPRRRGLRLRFRVGDGHRERLVVRIRSRLLMRRPRSRDGLAGHLEVVDQLRPGPDGRALARFRGVLDQLVEPRVTAAVPVGFNSHTVCSRDWTAFTHGRQL